MHGEQNSPLTGQMTAPAADSFCLEFALYHLNFGALYSVYETFCLARLTKYRSHDWSQLPSCNIWCLSSAVVSLELFNQSGLAHSQALALLSKPLSYSGLPACQLSLATNCNHLMGNTVRYPQASLQKDCISSVNLVIYCYKLWGGKQDGVDCVS